MAYVLNAAGNPMAIAERETAVAANIQFTTFTTCCGVVVLQGGMLTAVHLAMRAADNGLFDIVAAGTVLAALPGGYTRSMMIGHLGMWGAATSGVSAGYLHLIGALTNLTSYPFGDGTYGATINGAAIDPTYV